jgi:hypothetical protein
MHIKFLQSLAPRQAEKTIQHRRSQIARAFNSYIQGIIQDSHYAFRQGMTVVAQCNRPCIFRDVL